MKFAHFFATFLLLTLALSSKNLASQVRIPINYPSLNGIFSPTSSDRFFEAGREHLDEEVNRLNQRQQASQAPLLEIDPTLLSPERGNPSETEDNP
ncbi:MAG: hypothetical protein HC890_01455 [Chloroflexaceae bacterium]|nr:hypothetical protein [Chloroflexaceae bacterium]